MKSSYSTMIQSKYFSPAFNSAIFDGPVRIYFAQFHESLALKIYFMIQQKLASEVQKAKELSKASGANIFIMVYPTEDSFLLSFDGEEDSKEFYSVETSDEDLMIGLRGPIEDSQLETLIEVLRQGIQVWKPQSAQSSYLSEAEL